MRPTRPLAARATQLPFHGPEVFWLCPPAIQPGPAHPLPGAMPGKAQQPQKRTAPTQIERQPGVHASKNVPRGYAEDAIFIGCARDPSAIDLAEFSGEQQVCLRAIDDVGQQGCIAGEAGIPALPGGLVGTAQLAGIRIVKAGAYVGLERGPEGEFGLRPAACCVQTVEIMLGRPADEILESTATESADA